ncbi:MAG: Ig-like domain-containing protein [Bacilli bacterium]|nr:Ig-like domain-containing protein [Bacilli bacterium]
MKHNKLFAMLAVAAALAVSGCTGPSASSASAHKHTAAPDAPWKFDNNNHWKDCEANDGGKAENAKHTFGDPTDVVPATCTATGSQKVKCTVCGAEVTQTLPMKDHTWGEWEVITAATCTEAGSQKHVCSVCQTEETEAIAATGHTWGEWETITEATCDKDGSRKHVCSVCNAEETEVVEKLGHQLVAVGGEQQAPAGEATVRLYRCERCGETSLGFSADEPSEASLPHLMKGDNDGMRFFGRPIGNAMALTADGTSVNQQNNECVYCSAETGDFFEYVFTLNEEQANTLASARLYCDARPANYLSGDFWAYNRSADDWTPGYYIDGADEHVQKNEDGTVKMIKDHALATKNEDGSWAEGVELETEVKAGARIEDYRYILYVDGQPVDFDKDTSVPVKGSQQNMTRAEYVLPYTFNLHKGKNTISLRMAGGYRSEFYNFIFRPYVEPTPVTVKANALEIREGKTAQIESDMEGLTYVSSSTSVATVDATGLVTGVKAGKATITVSKEGNYKDAKVEVTVLEKEGNITIDLNGENNHVVAPEGSVDVYYSSYNNATRLRNWQKDGSITYTFQSELAGAFNIQLSGSQSGNMAETLSVKVNGAAVAVSGELAGSTYSPVDAIIGVADLQVGENTIEIKNLAESSQLTINAIKLFPHAHEWAAATAPTEGENDAVVERFECAACGMVKYVIAAKTAKMQVASSSDWKTDPTTSSDGAFKLNNGKTATFTFALPKAFNGKMYQTCYMDSYNSNKTKKILYATNNHSNIEVKVNDNAIDFSRYQNTTFQQIFGDETNGSNSLTLDFELGEVALATANTISYKRVETLNMLVTHFVFIGREAA